MDIIPDDLKTHCIDDKIEAIDYAMYMFILKKPKSYCITNNLPIDTSINELIQSQLEWYDVEYVMNRGWSISGEYVLLK